MSRRRTIQLLAVLLTVAALTLAACGSSSDNTSASSGTRTVEIEMRDIAFSPDKVDVQAGEAVKFVFRNRGKVDHDAFIGDAKAQEDHEMAMRQTSSTGMDGMGSSGSSGEGGITVKPGKTGELTHTFRAGDRLLIGCHEPGHYASGMKITINVS